MIYIAPRIMTTDFLKVIFFKKLSKYTDNVTLINNTFDDLLNDYTGEKRHYHALSHITNLLTLLEDNKFRIHDEETIFFAIWFHDVIYNTWKNDNEERSADYADEVLRQTEMPPSQIQKIKYFINATKTHTADDDNDLALFLDFDLSILGAEEDIYAVYKRQIREEFSSFPNFIYNRGRKKALRGILEKPYIYHSDAFRRTFENQARENIQRELDVL
jgi:predicted metal-dependent HD superfamily phosphohydrolase